MQLKRKSWHYRLATVYGRADEGSTDFCSYFWHLVLGLFFATAFSFIIAFFSFLLIVMPLIWIVVCIVQGQLYPPLDLAAVGVGVDTILVLLISAMAYKEYCYENGKDALPIPTPLREAYKAWKGKYCAVINFE